MHLFNNIIMKYQIIYCDPPWKYGSKELYGDKINGYKNGQRKRFEPIEEEINQSPNRE